MKSFLLKLFAIAAFQSRPDRRYVALIEHRIRVRRPTCATLPVVQVIIQIVRYNIPVTVTECRYQPFTFDGVAQPLNRDAGMFRCLGECHSVTSLTRGRPTLPRFSRR